MKEYKLNELGIENLHIELVDIDKIEDVGYINTIDLAVEVDETYCINDGIISHNSARGTVLTGLSEVNRDYWGVFPLKGRPLNVRDVPVSKIINNSEISNMIKIIGLVPGKKYTSLDELRYGKIVFFTDADCLEENTIVLTKSGEKKIKDITYDDYVLTHTGKYKRVINIIETIKTEMVSFSVSGTDYLCSKNHKLIVLRNAETIVIYAENLLKTDLVLIKRNNTNSEINI